MAEEQKSSIKLNGVDLKRVCKFEMDLDDQCWIVEMHYSPTMKDNTDLNALANSFNEELIIGRKRSDRLRRLQIKIPFYSVMNIQTL